MAVMVMNFGRLFFDLPLVPGASPSDGCFEVVVLRGRNVAELAPALMGSMMERLGLSADRLPGIDTYTASEIEVSAYPPLPMQYDGEVISALTPFKARVLPSATTLILPPGSPFAPA
jgi:diacylglycerol kinase family enzyme